MKLLLMVYECSPYRGSEPGVGWGRLVQAARIAEVHVVTSACSLAELERARDEGLLPAGVHLHTPQLAGSLSRLLKMHGHFDYNYSAYRQWQRCAFALARDLHQTHGFNVAHQATVCTFREPGYVWQLPIPFVWGPFGGTQNFPTRMLPVLPLRHALYEFARTAANKTLLRFSPHVRAASAKTAVVLCANSTNARDCSRAFQRPVEHLLETAIADVQEPDLARFHQRLELARRNEPLPPLRLLWSGQLSPRKGLPVLLHALALLLRQGTAPAFRLDVVGSGPEAEPWRLLVQKLGLGDAVTFHGRLPLAGAIGALQHADVFCFTSLRDTSGNVVLEALAAGVPVVAFNHQGVADLLTPDCGVLLPVTRPRAAIAAWAKAIDTLATDAALLLRLGSGTTAQARRFLWQANGDRVNRIYRRLAGATGTQPAARRPAHGLLARPRNAW